MKFVVFIAVYTTSRFRKISTWINTLYYLSVRQHQSSPCFSKSNRGWYPEYALWLHVFVKDKVVYRFHGSSSWLYSYIHETYNFAMFSLRYVKDTNLLFCSVIIRFVISFVSLLYRPNKIDLSLLCTMANQFERQSCNKKTSSVDTEKLRRCFAPATSRHGRWETKEFSHSSLNPTTIWL